MTEIETDATEHLLPIFPLSVVLMPGELLPLHIFEERYKAMMQDALEGERRFGLSYVRQAKIGVDTPPPIGSIGCTAQITAVIPLPDGKMNLLSVGSGRYVIREYTQVEPYLVARVEPLSDHTPETPDLVELADAVRALFDRLAVAARTLSNESGDSTPPELDVAPEALSFLIAANVALENDAKQEMLEMTDTVTRLRLLRDRLDDLVETYEYRAEMNKRAKSNGHGHKAPELEDEEEEE
jgi:Lon protease-like protein